VLVAALLGPSAAVIVISTVLIVQCLAFADGGITALGANIFNMAIIGGALGGMLYGLLARFSKTLFGRLVAAIIASWMVVVLASVAAAGELASSGTVHWNVAFPAMAWVHALIGLGEGAITALVLSAIAAARPELVMPALAPDAGGGAAIENRKSRMKDLRPVLVFGLLAAVGLALFVSPFASPLPDGLEYVAGSLGFADHERSHGALWSDYTPIAAGIAVLLLFPLAWLIARLIVSKGGLAARPNPNEP
jgi:cobalt/nickel transport system permease protein